MIFNDIYTKASAKQSAFIAVFFWASAFVLTKYILRFTDINTLAVGRYFCVLILLIFIIFKQKIKFPKLRDLYLFIFAGFSGYSGYMILFNIAMSNISPSTASVINALSPAITGIIAYFLFKEKINIFGWISLFISFIGILILTLWNGKLSINMGIFYMLAGCLLMSFYNISQRGLSKKYSSVEASFYSMFFGSLELIFYSPTSFIKFIKLDFILILYIIYLAIFASIVAYLFWTRSFEIAHSTTEVTSFMFVTPIIATIMGIIFLKDIPKLSTLIGGIVIILGMFLFNKTKNKK